MHCGIARLIAVAVTLVLLGACDKKPPFAPDGDELSLAVSLGDPIDLTSTAISQTQVDLAWVDMSARESGFELHRSMTGQAGTFATYTTTGADVTAFSDFGLTAATEYCYKVRSFRTAGRKTTYSGFSNTTCATTLEPPPPPPGPPAPSGTNARPANGLSQAAQITWTDNSSDEEGFRVERASSAEGPWAVAARLYPNNVSHIDYGRPLEQQLCYRVIAFKGAGESASNVDCTYLPASPTGLTAAAVADPAVNLAWDDNSAYEEGYDIERSDTGGWPFTTVGSVGADTKTFRDATVSVDKTYWYRVWVTREGARTGLSNTVTVITVSSPPGAPSELNATPYGSSISIIWTDNSANEEGFRVERSENGGASWTPVGSTVNRGLDDVERTREQQVCYRAIAFNSLGDSPSSNVDCTTAVADPTALIATTAPGFAIDLTWTDNSNAEDGYEVRRWFEQCGGYYYYYCYRDYVAIATVGPNATSYRDADLGPGAYHFYVVVALKDGGASNWSNEAGAWSDFPPTKPSNLTAAAVSRTQIDLAWSDNSTDEDNFLVSRCTGTEALCGDAGFTDTFWLGANVTTFSDTSVQPNTTYTYRIFSYRGRSSDPSNKASATTLP